jgi:hypothetical protein
MVYRIALLLHIFLPANITIVTPSSSSPSHQPIPPSSPLACQSPQNYSQHANIPSLVPSPQAQWEPQWPEPQTPLLDTTWPSSAAQYFGLRRSGFSAARLESSKSGCVEGRTIAAQCARRVFGAVCKGGVSGLSDELLTGDFCHALVLKLCLCLKKQERVKGRTACVCPPINNE